MQEKKLLESKKMNKILEHIKTLRARILETEYVCSGTIVKSMLRCGKNNCRCASDPDARHGPYYQWNRMKKGKLVHSSITAEQVVFLQEAIDNYRSILKLLRRWEEESRKIAGVK